MIWVTIVLSMIAAYLALWAGVISLIGFGAWRQIAEQFPATAWPEEEGVLLKWQSGSVGASNYGGVLSAIVAEDGLYLRPVRMFAFNHPTVFIPWGTILKTEKTLFNNLKLRLAGGKSLVLRGRLAAMARDALAAFDAAEDQAPGPSVEIPDESLADAEPRARDRGRTRA